MAADEKTSIVGTDETTHTMSDRRRGRVRLRISQQAARLFWDQGVLATSGEQIAASVGLSVRTLWRYFRNKESCAEPVIAAGVAWFLQMLRDWPAELSLADHYDVVLDRRARAAGKDRIVHDVQLAQMIHLGRTEEAIRLAWLATCDEVEQAMRTVIARRLDLGADDLQVRLHAAAATSVMRVINEDLAEALLTDAPDDVVNGLAHRLPEAVAEATAGAVGPVRIPEENGIPR